MAPASAAAAARALGDVASTRLVSGGFACAWCGLQGLSARGYWEHQPLYHI